MMREAYQLGLIGFPLEHSLSPHLHRAALRAGGLDGEYHLYPIPPGPNRSNRIRELLSRMRIGEIHGLNVTVPLKQVVMPFLDTLTPTARSVGAVNTIYLNDEGLVGDNTDVQGFWVDLMRQLTLDNDLPPLALVLGAGGAARAVVYALIQAGWQVIVAARRPEQARELVESLSHAVKGEISPSQDEGLNQRRQMLHSTVLSTDAITKVLADMGSEPNALALMVNATPLGMFPHTTVSPWPPEITFPRNAFVYDLVYNPAETLLMKQARQAGLPTANGLGMLIEQAALAFERWTGLVASREAMRWKILEK